MTQSSFYADGEVLDAAVVESNDVAGSTSPTTAPSGFYPEGNVYAALQDAPSVIEAITALKVATEAAASSAAGDAATALQAVSDATAVLASALIKANNLSDLANPASARVNLGLGNVDNTSDTSKPVSTAQQTALNAKAPLASPALTGTPTAPTATAGTNTQQIATTAFVEAVRVILAAADALKAPLASPALTGTPTAPTAAANTNNAQLATTAYVDAANAILASALLLKAPLASPALTGAPTAPTAAVGTNTQQIATTAFVLANGASVPPATATPLVDSGAGSVGVATKYAREDHAHPFPWTLGQIPATAGTTKPAAGTVGEQLVGTASPALATNTLAAAGQVTLTPGVWDIDAHAYFSGPGATASNNWTVVIGPNSASSTGAIYNVLERRYGGTLTADCSVAMQSRKIRITVASNTTYYLNVSATISAAYSVTGWITATRAS